MTTPELETPFWATQAKDLLTRLRSSEAGLTAAEASARLLEHATVSAGGPNPWKSLLVQFTNPIQILLIGAAVLSGVLGQFTDAAVIIFILLAGGLLSFQHEYRAGNAVAALMKLVETQCQVRRDGKDEDVPLQTVVPGDIVILSAGSTIPGDGLLLKTDSLFVDQAALTGESFPVEKDTNLAAVDAPIELRTSSVFAGTHVVSGSAEMVVFQTGSSSQLGAIAGALKNKRPEGDFQKGIRQLGAMLIQLTLFLTLLVFAVNVWLHRPVLESFMFSLALAVGLTPQLLPAIVSVNLSRGAIAMAADNVIVKRLASIENFGSMNVLCSDKTGTLTMGTVRVANAFDAAGNSSPSVLALGQMNAKLESGYANPIDEALKANAPENLLDGVQKVSEIPYDFTRKKLSVLIARKDQKQIITKGALELVVAGCSTVGDGLLAPHRDEILALFKTYSEQGFRVLGVASLLVDPKTESIDPSHETNMVFEGFLLLEDPLRPESADTILKLKKIGIELKMITGDNRLVAARLGKELGLSKGVLIGSEISRLSDAALHVRVKVSSIFAEIEPNQKQRIVMALKKSGAVVGYIGDGINDGPALHAADVSISVANAVDVAKEAADFVMLKPDLRVLLGAVTEGRRTFTNTMKYIFMATSANFGNMFSLAGASLLVPFLPLLAKQVLLTNLLTDLPEMTIATDNVDPEVLLTPQRWDMGFLTRFMFLFGLLSSIFDFSTFGVLLWLKATPAMFRTGWFTESVLSASLMVLVFRSRRWLGQSKPSSPLLWTTIGVGVLVLALPFLPIARMLEFGRLPLPWIGLMLGIVALYVICAELAKHVFFYFHAKRVSSGSAGR